MLEVKDPVHTRRRLQTVVLILVLKTACSRGTKKAFIYRLHLMAEKKKIVPYHLIGYMYFRKEENIPYA